jgi:hypothetical protein
VRAEGLEPPPACADQILSLAPIPVRLRPQRVGAVCQTSYPEPSYGTQSALSMLRRRPEGRGIGEAGDGAQAQAIERHAMRATPRNANTCDSTSTPPPCHEARRSSMMECNQAGGPSGTRTPNQLIKSQLLCQLS